MKRLCGIVLFFLLILPMFYAIPAHGASVPQIKQYSTNSKEIDARGRDAFYMAREFVKKRLKAPSTAKFISYYEEPSAVQALSAYTFIVRSAVDAQNSFGAMIRSVYLCKLSNKPGTDSWTCQKLVIE